MLNAPFTATFDQHHEVEFIRQHIYILFRKPAEFIVGGGGGGKGGEGGGGKETVLITYHTWRRLFWRHFLKTSIFFLVDDIKLVLRHA